MSITTSILNGGGSCRTPVYVVLTDLHPDRVKGEGDSKTVFPRMDQHAPSERQNLHRPVEALPR